MLWIAATLVIAERVGKAVRSPAKDTLLSHATAVTGRGKGFAVHEAMDQIGAITGPLLVAGMLALTHVNYLPTFAILALPGGATLCCCSGCADAYPTPSAMSTTTTSVVRQTARINSHCHFPFGCTPVSLRSP